MSDQDEIKRLKALIVTISNLDEEAIKNCPSGPPDLVRGYRVGYSNGWVEYRHRIKRLLYPPSKEG